MKEYIQKKLLESKREVLFKKIPVTVIGTINALLRLRYILRDIELKLKNIKYLKNIEEIYIGNFKFLKNRQIQSMFSDNCIYVSDFNDKKDINEEMVVRDIIHEIGHSLENEYSNYLYGDNQMEMEYHSKKKKLFQILKDFGYSFPFNKFLSSSEYIPELDKMLYSDIGYNLLGPIIVGLFTSPYSATSLSEYYANGFEQYHAGDKEYLRNICPILYERLEILDNLIKRG